MGNYKKNRKPHGWWTLEHCKETALQYSTPQELMKAEKGCHHTITDNHWQNECYAHMKMRHSRTHSFDKEELAAIALNFETRKEFRKNDNSAYRSAVKQGLLDEICSHMPIEQKDDPLTFETCAKAAMKYNTRSKFQHSEDRRFYSYARRHGFIDDICGHMKRRHIKEKRCIYAAKFEDGYVYVGLTCNHKERWSEHLSSESSAVRKHMIKGRNGHK